MTFEILNPRGTLVWYTVNTGRVDGWEDTPSVPEEIKKTLAGLNTISTRNGFELKTLRGKVSIESNTRYDIGSSVLLEELGIELSDDGGTLTFRDGSKMLATNLGFRNY